MWLQILMIVAGVTLVLWGADRLTDGAVALAERMQIPQIVIGLTIVAIGTSAPEFCVSLVSALKGTSDLAVGNVVGSNIFNTMLIVGMAAMVAPMTILPSTVKKDIPIAVVASFLLAVMVLADGDVSRLDALVLMLGFLAFMWLTLHGAKGNADQEASPKGYSVAKSVLLGLTVVAGGTSLPELATSVVAARKGNSGIAIGNVLGSNVMNILLILGGAGLICPMQVEGITIVDFSILTGSILLLWLFSNTKLTVARWEGAVLTILFLAYMVWLVASAV